MKNLNFETILNDSKSFALFDNDSYISTYPEFLNYFKKISDIERHHLVISSHFVYGWMPTIINLNMTNADQVILLLNAAKSGHLLNEQELETIKKCVNNSMVGASKLLHFINPENYAIWDSRIFRYATGKKSQYGINKPKAYVDYLEKLKEITQHKDYETFHNHISKNFEHSITPMRAIEILMFETDKIKQLRRPDNY